eukprot:g22626.t1
MEEQLHRFWDRYPMDERATKLLLSCAPDIQAKVIETFDPRNKEEAGQCFASNAGHCTSFVKGGLFSTSDRLHSEPSNASLVSEALPRGPCVGKHGEPFQEEAGEVLVEKRLRGEFAPPTEDEIATFCGRYPIDDRALDYLSTSPSAVQHKVLAEFRPRNENEPDYSSLVTSLVKKLRMTERTETAPTLSGPSGPSLDEMKDFRVHFPMDDRAWEFLLNAPGHTQEVVIKDFKPRRFDDGDYSAAARGLSVIGGAIVATDLAFWEDTVVFSSSDGSVKLWDLRTKAPQRSLMDVSNDPALSVTLTNGVCACARGTSILMADVSSGQIMADFADVHSERVSCVRFRPGVASSDLVSAGDDGLLCVLDTQRHPGEDEALRIAMNSEESVERLAFAADGQMLCSISTTDVMHLWSLSEPKEGILCARLDPMRNDQHLQVGESDGLLESMTRGGSSFWQSVLLFYG